jgi:anti-sigma regulatory factor (Ser/Thr protein kinase)
MNQHYELDVEAQFSNLSEIADFIQHVTTVFNFDEQAAYAVQLAVDEACSNIIEHAYRDTEPGRLRLTCEYRAGGLQIVIFDRGTPFDPDTIPDFDPSTPLNQRGRRGMGLFFISNLMDAVEYRFNTPDGNRLTLFKAKLTDEDQIK